MGFFEQLARDFQFNIIDGDRYLMLVRGLGTTVLIAMCAAIIGIVLGSVIALMRLSTWRMGKTFYPLRAISSFYVDVIRGTPMVVQLMIMYYVILASSSLSKELIAIISFGLNSAPIPLKSCAAAFGRGQGADRGRALAGPVLGADYDAGGAAAKCAHCDSLVV
ncbi:MAG: ABC transporter permease subunit [Christensenellales bacterium]